MEKVNNMPIANACSDMYITIIIESKYDQNSYLNQVAICERNNVINRKLFTSFYQYSK